jgi:hypothetical protein
MPDTGLTASDDGLRHHRPMKRPPVPLRIAILVAAVACLGLAMCGRSKQAPPAQPPTNTQQSPDPAAGSAPDPAPATAPAETEKPKLDPFPATKAPGRLYR